MISLNKFKGIEVISSILSKHNSVKPEINYRKNNGKKASTWRLTACHQKTSVSIQDRYFFDFAKKEIMKYLKTNESGKTNFQTLWDEAKTFLREKFIAISLPQEIRKISNKQSKLSAENWK